MHQVELRGDAKITSGMVRDAQIYPVQLFWEETGFVRFTQEINGRVRSRMQLPALLVRDFPGYLILSMHEDLLKKKNPVYLTQMQAQSFKSVRNLLSHMQNWVTILKTQGCFVFWFSLGCHSTRNLLFLGFHTRGCECIVGKVQSCRISGKGTFSRKRIPCTPPLEGCNLKLCPSGEGPLKSTRWPREHACTLPIRGLV